MSSVHASHGKTRRFKLTVTLEDASNFAKWRSALQEQLFATIRNTNMNRIVPTDTLDAKLFKAVFKDEWNAASKDAEGAEQDPFDDAALADKCFDHALKTGEGFQPWVGDVFAEIRDSLCDDIKAVAVVVAALATATAETGAATLAPPPTSLPTTRVSGVPFTKPTPTPPLSATRLTRCTRGLKHFTVRSRTSPVANKSTRQAV